MRVVFELEGVRHRKILGVEIEVFYSGVRIYVPTRRHCDYMTVLSKLLISDGAKIFSCTILMKFELH